jgi:hypothetical protein
MKNVPTRRLERTDAGWLFDYQRSRTDGDETSIFAGRAGTALTKYSKEKERFESMPSLVEWINVVRELPATDPRASEWTALEILRQVLQRVVAADVKSSQLLDELHPANILLGKGWLASSEEINHPAEGWTWDSWRRHVRGLPPPHVVRNKIPDYRRHPETYADETAETWRYRLRGCGLLLLGLIVKDFSLPSSWNVRGLERNVGRFVRDRLEEAVISSLSQSIIEAATLPRSIETSIIRRAPWAFFGIREVSSIKDTRADPPMIDDVQDLISGIEEAQTSLQRNQITVLNHAPRQLIPMNVVQLAGTAVALPEAE